LKNQITLFGGFIYCCMTGTEALGHQNNSEGRQMKRRNVYGSVALAFLLIALSPSFSSAWDDETHIAIAKLAGYYKWFNACGADMAKIKAGNIEGHNHYVNNPKETLVTPEMVLAQVGKYNRVDLQGHLYGAIIVSFHDYIKEKHKGKYGEYHLAFCAHYVGDLSQPLHNTRYSLFNRRYHTSVDGIVNNEILENFDRIKIYSIAIDSEEALAKEIARIANLSMNLGYKIEAENRVLTKEEAYTQFSHSASLFRAILGYIGKMN
jgi:hypothetical protein